MSSNTDAYPFPSYQQHISSHGDCSIKARSRRRKLDDTNDDSSDECCNDSCCCCVREDQDKMEVLPFDAYQVLTRYLNFNSLIRLGSCSKGMEIIIFKKCVWLWRSINFPKLLLEQPTYQKISIALNPGKEKETIEDNDITDSEVSKAAVADSSFSPPPAAKRLRQEGVDSGSDSEIVATTYEVYDNEEYRRARLFHRLQKLTDDDLANFLRKVNARRVTRVLVLRNCPRIQGYGLHPIKKSVLLHQLDIRTRHDERYDIHTRIGVTLDTEDILETLSSMTQQPASPKIETEGQGSSALSLVLVDELNNTPRNNPLRSFLSVFHGTTRCRLKALSSKEECNTCHETISNKLPSDKLVRLLNCQVCWTCGNYSCQRGENCVDILKCDVCSERHCASCASFEACKEDDCDNKQICSNGCFQVCAKCLKKSCGCLPITYCCGCGVAYCADCKFVESYCEECGDCFCDDCCDGKYSKRKMCGNCENTFCNQCIGNRGQQCSGCSHFLCDNCTGGGSGRSCPCCGKFFCFECVDDGTQSCKMCKSCRRCKHIRLCQTCCDFFCNECNEESSCDACGKHCHIISVANDMLPVKYGLCESCQDDYPL